MDKEGEETQAPRFILDLTFQLCEYVEGKYKSSTRNPKEARRDAIQYAAAQLAWCKVGSFLNPGNPEETEERKWLEEEVRQADKAIESARNGNWIPMKEYIQETGRHAMGASAAEEALKEHKFSLIKPEGSQKRGEAFFNLAISLNP